MAKKPSDRFQTPAEVAHALQPYSGSAVKVPEPLPLEPADDTEDRVTHRPPPEPRTDSQFRLPPPKPIKMAVPERTGKKMLIAVGASVIVLAVAALVIYLLATNSSELAGPPLDKEFKAVLPGKAGVDRQEMALALIPAGSFEMGSAEGEIGRGPEEGPVHSVEITKPFYMGVTEVTLRQYQVVVGQLPAAYVRLKKSAEDVDLDAPATMVSHGEATSFCRKLNAEPNSKKEGWDFRLPTEAEWEYACRAGSKSRYSGGDALSSSQAEFGQAAARFPGRVGRFPANGFGLFDMHGGVAEWVADMYDPNYYKDCPAQDPPGPKNRAMYVIRGGAFNEPAEACRCARRHARYPELSKDFEATMRGIGFRVVMAQTSK